MCATDLLYNNSGAKKFSLGLFLYIAKAFDFCNYDILLSKLHNIGICSTMYNWFSSYSLNRHQYTYCNSASSETWTISAGVPQGCVLGHLLFKIYINDIIICCEAPIFLFADDKSSFFWVIMLMTYLAKQTGCCHAFLTDVAPTNWLLIYKKCICYF